MNKHQRDFNSDRAAAMREADRLAFERIGEILNRYRSGAYEQGTCRYCERSVPVYELNQRGICERCEMEGP